MMTRFLPALGALSLLATSALPAHATKPMPADVAAPVTPSASDAVNALTEDFYNHMAAESDGNLVLSGASLSGVFALLRSGARGDTLREMDDVLHYGGIPDVELRIGELSDDLERDTKSGVVDINNAAWFRSDLELEPDYERTLESAGAPAQTADFFTDFERERLRINDWVADKTKNLIQDFLPPGTLNSRTQLVLVNTIYMKVDWSVPFDKSLTQDRPFAAPQGDVDVPTMQKWQEMVVAEQDGLRLASIPYADGLRMIIVMGDDVTERVDIDSWLKTIRDGQPYRANLRLPKFEIKSAFDELPAMLKTLGMKRVFSFDEADLSGLLVDRTKDLRVSDVIQKAVIKVDETGTEAAAASGIVVAERVSMPIVLEEVDFFVDRPFAYLIHDVQTDTVLFAGRVMNPLES